MVSGGAAWCTRSSADGYMARFGGTSWHHAATGVSPRYFLSPVPGMASWRGLLKDWAKNGHKCGIGWLLRNSAPAIGPRLTCAAGLRLGGHRMRPDGRGICKLSGRIRKRCRRTPTAWVRVWRVPVSASTPCGHRTDRARGSSGQCHRSARLPARRESAPSRCSDQPS